MAFSKLLDNILYTWAPVLVACLIFQLQWHHHHNQVVGFEYIEWKEFRSRDGGSLGISLSRNSNNNGTSTGNATASKPVIRRPREIDFYKPYGYVHAPLYSWNWSEPGDYPLPIEGSNRLLDWYVHMYTARNSFFPSQSLIILKDKEGKPHACGCVLLHQDLIVTTKSCIESKVAAKVVFRRNKHFYGIEEARLLYVFVKGFCVLDKKSKDSENDVAIGYLAKKIDYQGMVWPAAALPDETSPLVQTVGLVREGTFNGYNLLQKGCSKSPGGQEKDRTCYMTTNNGSRHICEVIDRGMGLYHLTAVEQMGEMRYPRIYLGGIMSQAQLGPPGCRTETAEGQWAYYVDFKKIPRLKEMITKCYI